LEQSLRHLHLSWPKLRCTTTLKNFPCFGIVYYLRVQSLSHFSNPKSKPRTSNPKPQTPNPKSQTPNPNLLRSYDTMILAYRHEYEGGGSFAPPAAFDQDLHAAAHALMRLAVIVMADYAA